MNEEWMVNKWMKSAWWMEEWGLHGEWMNEECMVNGWMRSAWWMNEWGVHGECMDEWMKVMSDFSFHPKTHLTLTCTYSRATGSRSWWRTWTNPGRRWHQWWRSSRQDCQLLSIQYLSIRFQTRPTIISYYVSYIKIYLKF